MNREPQGIPTGGQFATGARGEADVTLPQAPVSVEELNVTKAIAQLTFEEQDKAANRLVDANFYTVAHAVREMHPDVLRVSFTDQGDGRWVATTGTPADYTKPVRFARPLEMELPSQAILDRDYTTPSSYPGARATLTLEVGRVPKNGPDQTAAEKKYAKVVPRHARAVAAVIEAEVADAYPDARKVVLSRSRYSDGSYSTHVETLLDADGHDLRDRGDFDEDAWYEVATSDAFTDEPVWSVDLLAAEKAGAVERSGQDFILDLREGSQSARHAPVQAETLF